MGTVEENPREVVRSRASGVVLNSSVAQRDMDIGCHPVAVIVSREKPTTDSGYLLAASGRDRQDCNDVVRGDTPITPISAQPKKSSDSASGGRHIILPTIDGAQGQRAADKRPGVVGAELLQVIPGLDRPLESGLVSVYRCSKGRHCRYIHHNYCTNCSY